jgi:Nucleotidyltransferase domain
MNKLQSTLERVVSELKENLGENLYSCCLYGSAVRGDTIEGISDINLLIVLNESTPAAHKAISDAIGNNRAIDPFVLGKRGFSRSVRAFAPKFLSIQRNYKVLHGADPLKDVRVDPELERFLCEQSLRNLRLRLAHAFITRKQSTNYSMFLAKSVTPLFLRLSELLRLSGKEVPKEMEEWIPVLAKELELDAQLLNDLLEHKRNPRRLNDEEMVMWHDRVFPAVDQALMFMEKQWPA